MKAWHRHAIAVIAGLAVGAGGAWYRIQTGFNSGRLANGVWSTALNYGTSSTGSVTRASVALHGLLALPSTETVYWNASTDSEGRPLDGSCTYAMTGKALDARWWSVTYYDRNGYLVANPANIWSFSGASIAPAEQQGWKVTIGPDKPEGHWLPSAKGQAFELTLRMYNPGPGFRAAPKGLALPVVKRERCA
jgi:hypothetical protein